MKSIRKMLFVIALVMCTGAYTSKAQIEVRVRPHRPHVVRVEAPSRHHVWIDEEWEPRDGSYVFVGGHWAEPPRHGGRWAPGHWRHGHHGEVWVPGHWR